MIDEDDFFGAIGGMKIGRGNRSTRRKPAPACEQIKPTICEFSVTEIMSP
jgi:hypothetical protein